jgi:tetratricopeptide (TPR) repeat protein
MRPHVFARIGMVVLSTLGLLAASACQTQEPAPAPLPAGPLAARPGQAEAAPEPLKNEIPGQELSAVAGAHFQGLGYMEQYEYRKAVEAFREVRRRAPGWIPGAINLAIALLNDTGAQAEAAKKAGGGDTTGKFDEALDLLSGVLERDPGNPYAHFCRGIILEQQGSLAHAHQDFQRVTEIDPHDATSWYWLSATLIDPDNAGIPDARKLAKLQVPLLSKALECDPYLAPALYKLQMAYRLSGEPQKAAERLAQFQELNQDRPKPVPGPGNLVDKKYGEMGKYATVLDPFPRPEPAVAADARPPAFDAAKGLDVKLPEGERWVKPSDFTGPLAVIGRIRSRFGAGVCAFDADGDGVLDLFLTSAVLGKKGIRDALLLNRGNGRFEDASASFALPGDRASVGAAAADFDADRRIDLFLTGVGGNRLLRNRDGKTFEDVSAALKPNGPPALSLMARWLDLDQDGDLDLYVVNYCAAEHADKALAGSGGPPPGLANQVYRNDGKPEPVPRSPEQAWAPLAVAWAGVESKRGLSIALSPWAGSPALAGSALPHTGIAALDIDNDRDLDLVLAADGAPLSAVLNDRLGEFHAAELGGLPPTEQLSGLLVCDLDADDRADVIAARADGPALALRNTTERTTSDKTKLTFQPWPLDAAHWRFAQAIDLDLDGRTDLLGLPASTSKATALPLPAWARNEPKRFVTKTLPLGLASEGVEGLAAVDLVGDALRDVLITRAGEPPALALNRGNGHHWLALALGGHWRVKPELMRTNSHAIGTRVVLEGQGTHVTYDHTTTESGLGQSISPVVLGLGRQEKVDLVHLRWPDGVMQCELSVASNQKLNLAENNRKTGSCPVLFTWNGRRYECIGDFLGGGGLGYLIAPGIYSQPDRDEAVAIAPEQFAASDGSFRISITEPMDEVAYLDYLRLDVVDRPRGVSAAPDERFAPTGPRPSGNLLAWRTTIEPVRATDLGGNDVTATLRHHDRRTVDSFRTLDGWIGYAERHGVVLDFGTRLSGFGPSDALLLCLAGWVEYPYSQTNYAAATAGIRLEPPAIERQREDGSWETIEPHAGYPAGLPRLMTLDLSGKLTGPRCVIRIKTNMECYYDQAFVAVREPGSEQALVVTTLPVSSAILGHRGYMREVSPDGSPPFLYDYDHVDPAPLASFAGNLTRHGAVARLLESDDDRFCVVGPGDEVAIQFGASELPPLKPGWTRSYVLRATGYCKDADPFTATSDTVEPLPWRRMPAFPFAPQFARSSDNAFEAYLRDFQTRPAGGGRSGREP